MYITTVDLVTWNLIFASRNKKGFPLRKTERKKEPTNTRSRISKTISRFRNLPQIIYLLKFPVSAFSYPQNAHIACFLVE